MLWITSSCEFTSPTTILYSFQTAAMFLGELLCLIPHNMQLLYKRIRYGRQKKNEEESELFVEKKKEQKPFTNPLIFWIPACCDLGGSTLLSKYTL